MSDEKKMEWVVKEPKNAFRGITDDDIAFEFGEGLITPHGVHATAPEPVPERQPETAPAGPEPEDVAKYSGWMNDDPEFENVREAMRQYASTLPEQDQMRLMTDYRRFNEVYERTRKELVRGREVETNDSFPESVRERIIQSKEVHREPETEDSRTEQPAKDRHAEILAELQRNDISRDYRRDLEVELVAKSMGL